jgi:hypothetical protein
LEKKKAYILTKESGSLVEILKDEDLEQDFSKAVIVKIKHCVKSFDWMNELVRKELSEYLYEHGKIFSVNEYYYANMFNDIDFRIAHNEFFVYRMKNPLVEEFLKEGFYHFPLNALRKLLDRKKKESKKHEQNKNASEFAFDIFSSIIMGELQQLNFASIEKHKGYITAEAINLRIRISEVKIQSVVKKEQEMDDTFPLEISIIGKHRRSGVVWFRTTWGAIKQTLPGLILI